MQRTYYCSNWNYRKLFFPQQKTVKTLNCCLTVAQCQYCKLFIKSGHYFTDISKQGLHLRHYFKISIFHYLKFNNIIQFFTIITLFICRNAKSVVPASNLYVTFLVIFLSPLPYIFHPYALRLAVILTQRGYQPRRGCSRRDPRFLEPCWMVRWRKIRIG